MFYPLISAMRKVVFALILISSFPALCQTHEVSSYRFFVHRTLNKDKAFEKVKLWWPSFQDCASPRVLDTIRSVSFNRVICSGQVPVQYAMLGNTANGGIVKFNMSVELTETGADVIISEANHKATPGVKHKDGGDIFAEKPQKGSMIFAKTWKGYNEQFFAIIRIIENNLNKVL